MAEHILGLGTKKAIREIVLLGEKQLGVIEGYPKRIIIRAPGFEILASRPDYSGLFDAFSLRIMGGEKMLDTVKQAVETLSGACSLTTDDNGSLVVTTPAEPNPDAAEQVNTVLETLACACSPLPEVWRIRGEDFRIDKISVEMLFKAMLQYKASDVHLSPGGAPAFRVDNQMRSSDILGALSASQILDLIESLCTAGEWHEFQESFQTSFSFHQVGLGYSRISAFIKGGAPHCTIRFLPEIVPSFEELSIPRDSMEQLANLHHGLVLVTGMTGSGKSTTVAALVDWINSTRSCHILTIENPVEYVHRNKKATISQRNTGKDVKTFGDAVTGALRHDPDVIVIGEMRDPDTIRSAINAAATGHLVISTLHSNTASETINRIVSFFDPVERDLVKLQLRDCIRCIICQRLVPRKGGGRVPALEFMFNDIKPINDGIVTGNTDGIRIGMQQTVSHSFLFEWYLHKLYRDGVIELEQARSHSTEVSMLNQLVMGTYSIPRLDTIKAAGIQHQ